MKVKLENGKIVFTLSYAENHKAKSCGARWHTATRTWQAKANKITAAAVKSYFQPEEYDPAIAELSGSMTAIPPMVCDVNFVIKGTTLLPRQEKAVKGAWPHLGHAFFHCMGAGKTISSITLANLRYTHQLIDQLLVICPTSIKGVWKKEINKFSGLTMENQVQVLEAGDNLFPTRPYGILVMGVEGLSQGNSYDKAMQFVRAGRTMVVIDESSTIKNYDAIRSQKCWDIGQEAVFRLILSGTSVTQGIQDLYSQMYFLDPTIIGELSYYSFRNKYCVMGGFEQRKIVGYKDTELLLDKMRPYTDVILKGEMKLPAKQYQIREVKSTAEQIRACKELAREMTTELAGETITVQNTLEAMLRYQQIAGGHLPDGTRLGKIPKLTELLALLEEFDGKAIIWARYLPEVSLIAETLDKIYPDSVIIITGDVPPPDRQPLVDIFQENPTKRWLVANQATASKGLTITAATLAVYYSNTFSLEDREQSEDRNHRHGQHNEVMYIDLISDLKVDKTVVTAIANKKDVADYVKENLRGDGLQPF